MNKRGLYVSKDEDVIIKNPLLKINKLTETIKLSEITKVKIEHKKHFILNTYLLDYLVIFNPISFDFIFYINNEEKILITFYKVANCRQVLSKLKYEFQKANKTVQFEEIDEIKSLFSKKKIKILN